MRIFHGIGNANIAVPPDSKVKYRQVTEGSDVRFRVVVGGLLGVYEVALLEKKRRWSYSPPNHTGETLR